MFAVQRDWKYEEKHGTRTDWFGCVAWRKVAESVAKTMRKGNHVRLHGELQQGKENGKPKIGTIELHLTDFIVLGDKIRLREKKATDEQAPF